MFVMKGIIKSIVLSVLKYCIPMVYNTRNSSCPITIRNFVFQKILGINRKAYWPVHYTSKVVGVKNIYVGIGSSPGASPGCYIQGIGRIWVGNYVFIAPNVGIISANHDVYDHTKHNRTGKVVIGDYSWIGMNSVILPDVKLGAFTVVAAGAIVTKSFTDGYCVIGGNPARLIRKLDKNKCVRYKDKYEYYGYYSKEKFERKNSNEFIK